MKFAHLLIALFLTLGFAAGVTAHDCCTPEEIARVFTDVRTGETRVEFSGDLDLLPVRNIYDPLQEANRPVTDYSYEQITEFMEYPSFRRWTNMADACATVEALFGRSPPRCSQAGIPVVVTPRTARAYVNFQQPILKPVYVPALQVVYVDPVFPPWSPTYEPYW